MKPPRKQSNYKAAPPLTGTLVCPKGHERTVVDLNPENVVVKCAQVGCAHLTSIKAGFKPNEQPG